MHIISRHDRSRYQSLLLIVCCLLSAASLAQERSPLQVTNQHPLMTVFGLPPAESARILQPGQETSHISLDWASNYTTERNANEQVALDGESAQVNIRWRTGLDLWEFGVDVSFTRYAGGSLDSLIENWHDWFNLPNGGRQFAPRDQLRYEYVRDGLTALSVRDKHSGFGDTRLTGAWQVPLDSRFDMAIRGALKVPTGDSDKLLGSGSTDFNIGVVMSDDTSLQKYRASYYLGSGVLWTGDGDILPAYRENTVFYSQLGFMKDLNERWQLKAQIDTHSALYDSDLDPLGAALQFSFGVTLRVSNDLKLDLAIVEDAITDSSSDVSFHINLFNFYTR